MSQTKTPPAVRRAVLDRFQAKVTPGKPALYRCAGCGREFPASALEIDHVQPEIDSTPEQRSDPANLQPLCNPKGARLENSCHRKKTRDENQRRAALNRPAVDRYPALRPLGLATLGAGLVYTEIAPHPIFTGQQWTMGCAATTFGGFLTYLVYNGFRHRAPLERIQVDPEPEPAPGPTLDTERIVAAVREKVGAKGDVQVIGDPADFTISYTGTGLADHKDDERYDLLQKVTAKAGGRWKPTWDTQNDRVRLTARPDMPKMIHHPGLPENLPWHHFPIAPDVTFDLLVTPHILIAGETGGGKTAIERAMIVAALNAARRGEVEVDLCDPKQIEFMGFETWPGVRRLVSEPLDLWEFAFDTMADMNERYRLLKQEKVPLSSHKRRLIFWDEQEEFKNAMFDIWTSGLKDENGVPYKKAGEKVAGGVRAVARVLAMSRRCGIHNIINTQSPDADVFGKSGVRQNLPGRVAVGALDAIRAQFLFGDSGVGRDVPSSAKGRCTVQIGDGVPMECQSYYVPDPADSDINNKNTPEDWATLLRLGMPKELVRQ